MIMEGRLVLVLELVLMVVLVNGIADDFSGKKKEICRVKFIKRLKI